MNNNLLYTIYTNYLNLEMKIKSDKTNYNTKNLIGIYDESLHIWYNAWSLDNFDNKSTKLSKYILKYILDTNNTNSSTNITYSIIKSIICNSKIYITDEQTQIDLIVAIFMYYGKINKYNIEHNNNLYYWYALNDNQIIN